jgi:predicted RNA-binding Zn-ribbon protein involved in translation (DUF1610 family)
MIKKYQAIPVATVLLCDKCGGEMITTGIALTSNPPQYPYECPKCGHVETHTQRYPGIEWIVDRSRELRPRDAGVQKPRLVTP